MTVYLSFSLWSARSAPGELGHRREKGERLGKELWGVGDPAEGHGCSQMGGVQGGLQSWTGGPSPAASAHSAHTATPETMAPSDVAFSPLWPVPSRPGLHFFLCTLVFWLWIKAVRRWRNTADNQSLHCGLGSPCIYWVSPTWGRTVMRPWGSNPSLKHLPIGKCLLSTVAQLPMQAAVQKQAKTRI